MAGYIIHLAVGKVYSRNNTIEDEKSFEKGIMAPDMAEDKSKSHYGPYSSQPDLNLYLQTNPISTSYQEGYFLHLVTDYLFYNKFLTEWSSCIYEDYDKLNARIIQKYGMEVPEETQEVVQFKDGEISILSEEDLYRFINAVGKLDMRQIILQQKDFQSEIASRFKIEGAEQTDESTR